MTTDSIITLVGTIVTLISMFVAIKQASSAKNYREQIRADVRKISLAKCTRDMEGILDTCNQLPIDPKKMPRGNKVSNTIKDIKSQLDNSIGVLSTIGADNKIRENLVKAQTTLHSYEISYTQGRVNSNELLEIRSFIQDSISISNTTLYSIGEK
ncbi:MULTISPECIES: hypothetical protein [unclassified Psychrobacter]|uniref:hypothetical protein n=1 Tax=unclassified Psychrobacter TaxID=196806 RepID=UPI0004705DF9|nr:MULTISPECIES: hypothetical protein [unclassified Psychrobacter]